MASHTEDFSLDAGETPESSANDKQATSQKRREQVRKAQRYVPCYYQFVSLAVMVLVDSHSRMGGGSHSRGGGDAIVWFSRAEIPSTVGHIASAERST